MTVQITGDGQILFGTTAVIEMDAQGSFKVAQPFVENPVTIDSDYTLSTSYNAMTAGPVTIADGITVTVPDGSEWTIV